MKKIKKKTNKALAVIIVFGCFLFFTSTLASDSQSLTASVVIINPAGPSGQITAVPEKRIANVTEDRVQNFSTSLNLKVFYTDSDRTNEDNMVYSFTTTTNDAGRISYYLFDGLALNTYDVTVKGYSHLTRLLEDRDFSTGYVELDFTEDGENPLLSGDINLTSGDDEINALDVSILVDAWNSENERADLNRDDEVNSIDISNLLANFNAVGD